ncbi:MAG: formylglycine-generating enzyme family protein, partial [Bacteroides sp.]|nr:formylglycine-generating enzyme family protein [Bacteroides sp.]
MKSILLIIFILSGTLFSTSAYGQPQAKKKVAIYVPQGIRDKGSEKLRNYAAYFASELQLAVTKGGTYTAVERTRAFLDLVNQEQDYQRSGQVDDEEGLSAMGKQLMVDFVLSVALLDMGGNAIYVVWKLIDVETAEVNDGDSEMAEIKDMVKDLKAISEALAGRISGVRTKASGGSTGGYGQQSSYAQQRGGQDYVENAWGLNLKMVWVEGGSFIMGCTGEQGSDCGSDEKNTRRVSLTGYYIGMTEVTQGQWQKVMGSSVEQQRNKVNSNYSLADVGTDYPMYYVSWEEAMAFCEELSRQTGKKYTLPTEAQWEYAARGGNRNDGTKYSGSYSIDAVAWYTGNSGNSSHM